MLKKEIKKIHGREFVPPDTVCIMHSAGFDILGYWGHQSDTDKKKVYSKLYQAAKQLKRKLGKLEWHDRRITLGAKEKVSWSGRK